MLDAVVVGSGPNGLAAAVTLALAGRSVVVLEAREEPGGGVRSAPLTLPGFVHDVCSTVHPLACSSPFLRSLQLERHGVTWRESSAPLAHVVSERHAVSLERSVRDTALQFGEDASRYEDLLTPFVTQYEDLLQLLAPLHWPEHLGFALRFASKALLPMKTLAASFRDPGTRGLLAGLAAHAMLPLDAPATSAIALVLAAAGHAVGWPVAQGGSGSITQALVQVLREAGGELRLGHTVRDVRDLPPARVHLFDVTPRQLLTICGEWLSPGYRRRLSRYRYGPGVFKVDWALSEAVPWTNSRCRKATTIHLSGGLEDILDAQKAVHAGQLAKEPFLLFVQPCLADPSRAPEGKHIGWAYCNVPPGSSVRLTEAIEAKVERFAPGFRDIILARSSSDPVELEQYNANYVGGDINGGLASWDQLLFRPVARLDPYATSNPQVFLCSASTPPGGGVHGLCGNRAAQSALRRLNRAHDGR